MRPGGKSSTRRRWRPHLVLLAVMAMITAACGARVAPYLGAAQVQPGSISGSSAGTPSNSPAVTTPSKSSGKSSGSGGSTTRTYTVGGGGGTSSGGAAGSGGGSTSHAGGSSTSAQALTPATFNLSPAAEAQYCGGTTGNTATGPGVTPSAITVGNVSGFTGLISGSFSQGYQAVEAAFRSVDRFGGVCGRQLGVLQEDDQQSASTNEADVQYLVPKVLAFVGSLSDADNGGVPAMEAAGTPDMGPAININRSNSSVYWSATGGSVTVRHGQAYINNGWFNGLKQYHDLPSNIAVLAYDIPISASAAQEYAALFQKSGVSVCYTNYSIPPAPGAEMNSVVQAMQSKGCQGVFTTMDIVGNADMLDDMSSDGYSPKLVSTTYEGYTPTQISLAGEQQAQGLQVALSSLPLNSSNAAVHLYEQELATYEPNQAPSEFGLEAWADAQMFIYALIKGGRNPTRSSLTHTLSQITNWTTGGSFGAYTPNQRTGPTCVDTVQVKGNGFVTLWPSSGLYCNGQLVDVGPAS